MNSSLREAVIIRNHAYNENLLLATTNFLLVSSRDSDIYADIDCRVAGHSLVSPVHFFDGCRGFVWIPRWAGNSSLMDYRSYIARRNMPHVFNGQVNVPIHIIDTIEFNNQKSSLADFQSFQCDSRRLIGGPCLLLGDIKLPKQLRSLPRGVRIPNFSLVKNLPRLNPHLLHLNGRDPSVQERRTKCEECISGYGALSGVLAICFSLILALRCIVKGNFSANNSLALLQLPLAFLCGTYGVYVLGQYLLNRFEPFNDRCEVVVQGHSGHTVPRRIRVGSGHIECRNSSLSNEMRTPPCDQGRRKPVLQRAAFARTGNQIANQGNAQVKGHQ